MSTPQLPLPPSSTMSRTYPVGLKRGSPERVLEEIMRASWDLPEVDRSRVCWKVCYWPAPWPASIQRIDTAEYLLERGCWAHYQSHQPALCFSSYFLFLPFFFCFYRFVMLFTPENPQKIKKKFNLKKNSLRYLLFNIHILHSTNFFFLPENPQKHQKKNLFSKKIHFYCKYLSASLCHSGSANLWNS